MSEFSEGESEVLVLSDLLAKTSSEIASLARASTDLQISLGKAVKGSMELDTIAKLQSLDLITQTLEDLAQFLNLLADNELPPTSEDLRKELRLADVADRLLGPRDHRLTTGETFPVGHDGVSWFGPE